MHQSALPEGVRGSGVGVFEREFLSLAGTMLATRFQLMGGDLDYEGSGLSPEADISLQVLGMTDYEGEMRLLCREVLSA